MNMLSCAQYSGSQASSVTAPPGLGPDRRPRPPPSGADRPRPPAASTSKRGPHHRRTPKRPTTPLQVIGPFGMRTGLSGATPSASSAASSRTAWRHLALARRVEQAADEGRADDHAVGVGGDLGRLGAGADAQTRRRPGGQVRTGPLDQALGGGADRRPGAPSRPSARRRRRSRCSARDDADALLGRARRDQEDRVDPAPRRSASIQERPPPGVRSGDRAAPRRWPGRGRTARRRSGRWGSSRS